MVVRLSWLSGRALVAQARGVLGSTPSDCRPFHFPLFSPIGVGAGPAGSVLARPLFWQFNKIHYKNFACAYYTRTTSKVLLTPLSPPNI